ncbi:MAG TPA: tRNA pseudouridine(55) synthase TruB [Patescibacteria group bacterium]|jgi:tRNA pseudouridine55 synthase|nr:tRNA pseudouridine(55) synthase TruB [Patescibacteria group bacterium]
MTPLEGLLVVDKPAGPTSHDIVDQVRRFTPGLRVGHTGTLDPFATGVLALCLGRATRLARFLTAARKTYEGAIRLGVTTDTYDIDGRVLTEAAPPAIDAATLELAVRGLTGRLMQTPPRYSARKIKGRPMYRLAREGREVAPEPSPVIVYRFEITERSETMLRFVAETSPGTYVRSLAHDLGAALGCGGCLVELRRTASGSFEAAQAHAMPEILQRGRAGTLSEIIIPPERMDLGLPSVTVTTDGRTAMRSGRVLSAREFTVSGVAAVGPGPVRVEDQEGNLLGVALQTRDMAGAEVLQPDVVLVA